MHISTLLFLLFNFKLFCTRALAFLARTHANKLFDFTPIVEVFSRFFVFSL